jgi:SAM-dependent methyltransferase
MSAGGVSIQEVLGRQTVHPFPARMAPGLALEALSKLRRPATVLDPMVGSGTVLAIARARGHRAIGFDVDPLAVLISRVWTRTVDLAEVRRQATQVLQRAKRLSVHLRCRDAYPVAADQETRAFVRYWFDNYARRQLAALSMAISETRADDIRDTLWCAFSRQIIAKQAGVSLALDLAHSRPHRVFERAPRKPFSSFLDAVARVISGCLHREAQRRGPAVSIEVGDVRRMPLPSRSVDLVFTSPPYLNAIDYLRCSKFSLVWMGYPVLALRAIRSASIGAEVCADSDVNHYEILDNLRLQPALSPRMNGILRRYVDDTDRALKEVARVLAPRGQAVYVVGENTIRGTYVPTGQLIAHIAAHAGLELKDQRFRDLPSNRRYLPPPGASRTALDTRIRREVILTFEKSG